MHTRSLTKIIAVLGLLLVVNQKSFALTTPAPTVSPTPTPTVTPETCASDISPFTMAGPYDTAYLSTFTTTVPVDPAPLPTIMAASGAMTYETSPSPIPSVDCDNPTIKIECSSGSNCYTDPDKPGYCRITVVKALCDKYPSLPKFGSLEQLLEWIRTHPATDPYIYELFVQMLHEIRHCKDRCKYPKLPGCKAEINAYEENIAMVERLMAQLECGGPNLSPPVQQWCAALADLLASLKLSLGVNRCVCKSDSQKQCETNCLAECKSLCNGLGVPKYCSKCSALVSTYCKNKNGW